MPADANVTLEEIPQETSKKKESSHEESPFVDRRIFSAKDIVYCVTVVLSVVGGAYALREGLDNRLKLVEQDIRKRQPIRDYLEFSSIYKQINGVRVLEQAVETIIKVTDKWKEPHFTWATIDVPDWTAPMPRTVKADVVAGPPDLIAIENHILPLDDMFFVTRDEHFLAIPDQELVADVFQLQELILVFNRALTAALASPDPRNPPGLRGIPSESLEGKRRADVERFVSRAKVLIAQIQTKLHNLDKRLATARKSLESRIKGFEFKGSPEQD